MKSNFYGGVLANKKSLIINKDFLIKPGFEKEFEYELKEKLNKI